MDENRFSSLEDMNKKEIRAGVTDGEIYQAITRKLLPKVVEVALPNLSSDSQLFIDLANGKTDVVIYEPYTETHFAEMNPDQIKEAFSKPVGVSLMGFAVGSHEGDLRDMLDVALLHLQNIGKIDLILNSYGLDDTMVYRATPIFDAPLEGK